MPCISPSGHNQAVNRNSNLQEQRNAGRITRTECRANVYNGFKPGSLEKSGLFELYSPLLASLGHPGLPTYQEIPIFTGAAADQLPLSTFKLNVQTLSSTANAPWLTEIEHDCEIWINPLTAAKYGIREGGKVHLASKTGELYSVARLTQGIVPGALALSLHSGHWEGGRYASDKQAPYAVEDKPFDTLKWWKSKGCHPNSLIADQAEPVTGQQNWMDTLVTIEPA